MSPTTAATIRRALQHLSDTGNNSKNGRPPSQRAQEIYRRVTIDCEPQKKIARELNITPSRISQIVSHVRRWLAQGSQPDVDSLSQTERRRLELALAKARHEGLYHRAIRDYDHQHGHPHATTLRTESKPSGAGFQPALNSPHPHTLAPSHSHTPNGAPPANCQLTTAPQSEITKVVSTTRPLPPAVQLLKTAQRSATELQRMAQRDNPERDHAPDLQSQNEMPSDENLFSALKTLLLDFRRRAEKEGRVPASTNLDQLLENLLAAFLGIDQGSGGGFLFLDDAIRHFAKTFLLPTVRAYPPVTEPQELLTDLLATRGAGVSPAIPSPTPHSAIRNPHFPPAPLTSPQLNPPQSPPNSSPTPSLPTPSAPQPKKQKSSPTLPHPLTPAHSRTRNSHPSHPSPQPDNPPLGIAFATHFLPADPEISLASFFHPTTRPF